MKRIAMIIAMFIMGSMLYGYSLQTRDYDTWSLFSRTLESFESRGFVETDFASIRDSSTNDMFKIFYAPEFQVVIAIWYMNGQKFVRVLTHRNSNHVVRAIDFLPNFSF